MQLVPIDENGFWGFAGDGPGGFFTIIQVGPFDFLRFDYTRRGMRDGPSRPFLHREGAIYDVVHTTLYPIDKMPILYLATKEEIQGDGNPT